MRALLWAAVLTLMPALVGQATASAAAPVGTLSATQRPARPPPLSIRVKVGYGEQYRSSAWTPVRVSVRNRTAGTVSGTVMVPDRSSGGNGGPTVLYHTMYQSAVVLPAGTTKQVTLYVPGYDDLSVVNASFQPDDRTLKTVTASDIPAQFDSQEFTIGALATDGQSAQWLNSLNVESGLSNLTHLTVATVDPEPEALANFDLIMLTGVDASQLRQEQWTALERYVQAGGALVLVGGPNWQETLRPLPAALLPGTLVGAKSVAGLPGLTGVGGSAPPRRSTIISVLTHPNGYVRASQGGVPLIVQRPVGQGQILYVAFDPELAPVAQWRGRATLASTVLGWAAPRAVNRGSIPTQYGTGPMPFCCGPVDLSSEVSNVPAAALPSLILFIVLTVLYVLLLGPLNFLVLRRLRRREWSWVTIPALAALCMGSTFGVAFHLKGNTVLVNSVATISLQGTHGPYPATVYAGLFAPLRGDYHLTYSRPALPAALAQPNFYSGPGTASSNPLTLRFNEGAQTRIDFLSMNMWSMREVALHTTVDVAGALSSQLTLDRSGHLTGTIHNGTNLDLVHPVVLAGDVATHLPSIPGGRTVHVRLRAESSTNPQGMLWTRLYGQPSPQQFVGGPMYYGQGLGAGSIPFLSGPACCAGPLPPQEHNLNDRIRNVAAALPETQIGIMPGEVTLLAWSQRSLGSLTVDGTAPQRRDLNLVMAPLSVHLARGPFTLPTGALGARLIEASPGDVPARTCCPFDPRVPPLYVGAGGSATFQFDIPGRRVHFRRLALEVNAGGALGDSIGHAYNWNTGRWDAVDLSTGTAQLSHPDRYVSTRGALLVQLKSTSDSGTVIIGDAQQQLQISGTGTVG